MPELLKPARFRLCGTISSVETCIVELDSRLSSSWTSIRPDSSCNFPPFATERAPRVFYVFVLHNETWRLLVETFMLLWTEPMLLRPESFGQ